MPADPPAIAPLLIDERNARRALGGISRASLWNYRRAGLPFVKLPGRIMFEPDRLREWIAARRMNGNGEGPK